VGGSEGGREGGREKERERLKSMTRFRIGMDGKREYLYV
jgi:hypothetical protein